MDVLVTDKTGTLTEGRITFTARPRPRRRPVTGACCRLGLLATETDRPTGRGRGRRQSAGRRPVGRRREPPRRHWPAAQRLGAAALRPRAADDLGRRPEAGRRPAARREGRARVGPGPLRRRPDRGATPLLEAQFAAGSRVVAVAVRAAPGTTDAARRPTSSDLTSRGFLVFLDPPKIVAPRRRCERLAALGISVKVLTGDNPLVAAEGLRATSACPPAGPDRRRHRGHWTTRRSPAARTDHASSPG